MAGLVPAISLSSPLLVEVKRETVGAKGTMSSNAAGEETIEPLAVIEQVTGMALAMALWDLSLGCRVEPDMFSVRAGEKPKVATFNTDDYFEAVQRALEFMPQRFNQGASICCVAYQGRVTTEEGNEQRGIMIQVFWDNGDEALVTVPWEEDDHGTIIALGALEAGASKGSPNLQALEAAVIAGLTLHPKGYKVWEDLKDKAKPQ